MSSFAQMSWAGRSLLDLSQISDDMIFDLLSSAEQLYQRPEEVRLGATATGERGQALNIFFEPSTRTMLSFELAAIRSGLTPLRFADQASSSLSKDESLEDTLLNLSAMQPSLMVVRAPDDLELLQIAPQLSCPIINAGWGRRGHPTQSLLDALTAKRELGSLERKKWLFVGDVSHSRVVQSHLKLLPRLGVEVGICAPDEFLPRNFRGPVMQSLAQALEWADIVYSLRVQLERHRYLSFNKESYVREFQIDARRWQEHAGSAYLMHAGPVNWGTELEQGLLGLPRCLIHPQVKTGVILRQALIELILEGTGRDGK